MDDALRRNVRLAVATGADVPAVLAVALATAGPTSVREAIELLTARADEIEEDLREGGALQSRRPAELEPELRFTPELAAIRRDLGDHEIRGKLLYRDLLGKRSFFQVAIWAIAGLELSAEDAAYVEQLGLTTQLLDAQIWPMAVIRRVAASGAPLGRSLAAGVATLFTKRITAEPVGSFLTFLDRASAAPDLEAFLAHVLASREIIAGFGRPVIGRDERVPQQLELARAYGHAEGASLALALRIESILSAKKGLHLNAAGAQAALLRDLGFSARSATAVSALYFLVPALAQATFSADCAERRR